MTFLPIVERELRVAARRGGTYGLRLRIAGFATLVFAGCFAASQFSPAFPFGQSLFWGLAGLCMIYCLAAGRLMTADCLSREKRDGTFGLLFLTDLKGYDVVLGKLAATSIDGFYGLVAVFPLLAVPILVGGMTNGELWRMALVLVNTFLFSLAIGLLASAVCRNEQMAMGMNFGLWLLLTAAPSALAGILIATPRGPRPLHHELLYSCPIYSCSQCADALYKSSPGHFWKSLGTTFGLSLVLVLLACRVAPQTWQDKPATSRSLKRKGERRWRWWREGRLKKANAFRARSLALNAYCWLTGRPYLKASYVWTATFLMGCCWLFTTLKIGHLDDAANIGFAFILNGMLKMWIAAEAAHQLAEDKRSGAFELLLSTPLTARDIVSGQWLALRRQFLKPVAVAVIVELMLMWSVRYIQSEQRTQAHCIWLAGLLMLLADLVSVSWIAMSEALTEKTLGRATAKAAALVLLLPWILFGALAGGERLVLYLFFRNPWDPGWGYDLGWWFGLGILVDVWFVLKARRRLQASFHQFALESIPPKRRLAWLRDAIKGRPDAKIAPGQKLRRVAAAIAVIFAAGAGVVWYVHRATSVPLPKPLVVSLSQSNHPVQVFAGQGEFLFILPDGSLWRWGRPGWDRSVIISQPQQIGTNRDWAQVSAERDEVAGVHSNGSLWSWDFNRDTPKQIGSNLDWVEAQAGGTFTIARKRDGTLWAWGDNNVGQLGNGPGSSRREVTQVGTNGDWAAINSIPYGSGALAMRTDGTLWAWGIFSYLRTDTIALAWGRATNLVPMQICRESNWAGFSGGFGRNVRNRAGESWSLFPSTGLPDADAPANTIGQLLSSNSVMTALGQLFATNWTLAVYELRPDGTLWTTPISWPPIKPSHMPPRRFGNRSDWVSVWGDSMTMIGLTSDGTMWIWGLDHSQQRRPEFGEKLDVVKERMSELLGSPLPRGARMRLDDEFQGYQPQKEPRPLFRLVSTNSSGGHSSSPNHNPSP